MVKLSSNPYNLPNETLDVDRNFECEEITFIGHRQLCFIRVAGNRFIHVSALLFCYNLKIIINMKNKYDNQYCNNHLQILLLDMSPVEQRLVFLPITTGKKRVAMLISTVQRHLKLVEKID